MYTYGPVPSRRLGNSLGVSPIPPKTCSYTCVYCQLGRTTHLEARRRSFYPKEDILEEIISRKRKSGPDYITFVGDGEPTLCLDLGWLISRTKSEVGTRVAVITNGSLLDRSEVREELREADAVIPTLDAGNEKCFAAINRPHRSIGFESMLRGLIDFRKEYPGQLWLEVMLVSGVNDTDAELESTRRAVESVRPDRVYITTPIRPPAESWVTPPAPERIIRAQQVVGNATAIADLEDGEFGLEDFADAEQAILEIGSRHPLRLEQAERIQEVFSELSVVKQMLDVGTLAKVEYDNEVYLIPGTFIRGQRRSDRDPDGINLNKPECDARVVVARNRID